MKKIAKTILGGLVALASLQASAATFVGNRSDFRDETIYFAMTTRFYDGDPSNNSYCWDGLKNDGDPEWRGDFKGLIEKLDYIKALGFTAVWITPVVENASGLDYHGYHAFDFSKVDPRYESEDVKFQNVIDEAHSRGMKVILDVVLQHTGNFGEAYLCPMFTKNYNVNQSNHTKTMKIIKNGKLPDNYWSLPAGRQHDSRLNNMKNTLGNGGDPNNYWHHVGQQWDWDDYRRVWGQIAGDCVDLNTENPHVYNYIIDCYTRFINMGVDGFRIDTTGHIARLTFNKVFIPRLHAAAESAAAKAKRGGTPFYMFGECCAVSEEAIYRGQHYNCSPCFYTWAETKDYAWDENEESWNGLTYYDCDPKAYNNHPNGASVNAQGTDYAEHPASIVEQSDNAWLNGNDYHTPDYSKSSNFNVIDFPMHQRFHDAKNAFTVRNDDYLYNDATWNVTYVDSHDYGPNGYKVETFCKGEDVWAENLSLMFTFRGIPCIFQGTESRFRRDRNYWIDQGANQPLKETLRAYYGGYLTGSVTTTDFAEYTGATGNLAATLSHPLAQHLMRLNKIRAAVPALRKGQYSVDGCSGEMAFKRRYVDSNTDSYALVAISGDATFSGILNGKYVDAVTGDVKNVTDGSLSVSCPGKANIRVYVLDTAKTPAPGKIGEDGKYIYTSSPSAIEQPGYDGNEEADDNVTVRDTEPYNPSAGASVKFSPAGGSFRTETLEVTATLSDAVSGWYKVADGPQVSLTPGDAKKFTIGGDMGYGETVSVSWGAKDSDGQDASGTVTYKKVDPNSMITVYVTGKNGADISGTNLYAWNASGALNGAWPGKALTDVTTVDGRDFYYASFDTESLNVIFSRGGAQTGDIEGLTEDTYFEYDGGSSATKIDVQVSKKPSVKASPASGTRFNNTLTVTLTPVNASEIRYTLDGSTPNASSRLYSAPIVLTETTDIKTFVTNSDGSNVQTFSYVKSDTPAPQGFNLYFDNRNSNWNAVYCYVYGGTAGNDFLGGWPGKQMTYDATIGYWHYFIDTDKDITDGNVIFTNNSGAQTGDNVKVVNNGIYNASGYTGQTYSTGVSDIATAGDAVKVWVSGGVAYTQSPVDTVITIIRLDGVIMTRPVAAGIHAIDDLPHGFYVINRTKVVI